MIRTAIAFLALPLVLAPMSAGAQNSPPNANSSGAPAATLPTAAAPGVGGNLGPVDANFVQAAAVGGMAEVQEAQIAENNGAGRTVENFARRMITDHTKLNQKLKAIAKRQGFTLPSQLDAKNQSDVTTLTAAHGKAFDSSYITDQVADHEAAVAAFQQEADQGADPELKAFALKALPILQHHLAMAKQAMTHST
jgi:putative membrane protein